MVMILELMISILIVVRMINTIIMLLLIVSRLGKTPSLCTFGIIPPRRTSAAAYTHQKRAEIFSSDDPPRVRLVSVKRVDRNYQYDNKS